MESSIAELAGIVSQYLPIGAPHSTDVIHPILWSQENLLVHKHV